jgi:hypothetical protein
MALAGITLDSNVFFVAGIIVGIVGYLGIRKELRRSLEKEESSEEGRQD